MNEEKLIKEFIGKLFYKDSGSGKYYPKYHTDCDIYNQEINKLLWDILQ